MFNLIPYTPSLADVLVQVFLPCLVVYWVVLWGAIQVADYYIKRRNHK